MSQSSEKAADMARQVAANEAGNRKHAQMEADIYSDAGHQFERQFFNMTRTERQQYGLRTKHCGVSTAGGYKKSKSEWISKCCKKEAFNYRSVVYGAGKPPDRYFRCRGCYNDCEATLRPQRKKKGTVVPSAI